jgi:protein-S-isoprenylcysteine O-methyltransferase Ste14
MNESREFTRPRIFPPVWLLLAMLLQFALDRWLPLYQVVSSPWNSAGAAVLLAGLGCILWAGGAFARVKTGIVPFTESTALVTHGLYRVTRNPMYLGMVLMLFGVAVILGSVTPPAPALLFAWIIDRNFIRNEELFLAEIHGDPYLAYKNSVRRWL